MDALGDHDAVLVALHGLVAAGGAGFEVVPRDVHQLAVQQPPDAAQQQLHVDAVGRLPVRRLRRTLLQRQEEIIHAQKADLHAQILQIVPQTHGGGGLAAAGGAGQRHDTPLPSSRQNGGGGGRHLVVEYLLAALDELRLVIHRLIDGFNIDYTHKVSPFKRETLQNSTCYYSTLRALRQRGNHRKSSQEAASFSPSDWRKCTKNRREITKHSLQFAGIHGIIMLGF